MGNCGGFFYLPKPKRLVGSGRGDGGKIPIGMIILPFLASEWGFGTMGREGESFSFTYGKRNRAAAVLRGGADF